ncbi:MAG: 50S ribosomal protein L17 [Patescibacteria group bacterium]|nr:50S ribosomal protein L17 [Patescibacteria group bacterium]
MKKNVFGRKLKRDKNERKALFKSLMSSLVLSERIKTTEAKAKAIKPEIEKLVTKAKKNEESAKKVLEKSLSKPAFDKMLKDIAPRFSQRQGGYTRLIKLGKRFGDDAPLVVMEWTEEAKIVEVQPPKTKEEKTTKTVKKTVKKVPAKKTQPKKANPSSRKATKGK